MLQDLLYWYDPVGNITLQKDDAQQTIFYDNTVAEPTNDYTYDALYRLIKCEGREHAGSNAAVSYSDSTRIGKNPLPTDASAMRRYTQYYEYDGVGNMRKMRHATSGGTGNWTRDFDVDTTSNKLLESSIGSNGTGTESYTYDARGNMIDGMNHLVAMEYNEENRLEKVEVTPTVTAYYQYDAAGQRLRKVIANTGSAIKQVRKYVGDWEVYQRIDTGTSSVILERETLHIDDHDKRIAIIETPTVDILLSGELQLLRYQYSNNIGTASLELDYTAAVITYEEYYPFGSTSYQGGRSAAECSLKRYRYTGKERDEETGLNYHGARYYAPWLARWLACEPINSDWYNAMHRLPDRNRDRRFDVLTTVSFEYCYANPVRFIDSTGEQPGVSFLDFLQVFIGKGWLYGELEGVTVNARRNPTRSQPNKPDEPNSTSGWDEKDESFFYSAMDVASQSLNAAGVAWGTGQLLANGEKVAGFAADLVDINVIDAATRLEKAGKILGKIGTYAGFAGIIFSSVNFFGRIFNSNEKDDPTVGQTVNYINGAAIFATALIVGSGGTLAPVVAGIALVYGAVQLVSWLVSGKSLEENIFD